jgi:hypothetical protein
MAAASSLQAARRQGYGVRQPQKETPPTAALFLGRGLKTVEGKVILSDSLIFLLEIGLNRDSLQSGKNVKSGERAIEGNSGDAEATPTSEK